MTEEGRKKAAFRVSLYYHLLLGDKKMLLLLSRRKRVKAKSQRSFSLSCKTLFIVKGSKLEGLLTFLSSAWTKKKEEEKAEARVLISAIISRKQQQRNLWGTGLANSHRTSAVVGGGCFYEKVNEVRNYNGAVQP